MILLLSQETMSVHGFWNLACPVDVHDSFPHNCLPIQCPPLHTLSVCLLWEAATSPCRPELEFESLSQWNVEKQGWEDTSATSLDIWSLADSFTGMASFSPKTGCSQSQAQ